jgi:lipopolysaccharide transport system permease protein
MSDRVLSLCRLAWELTKRDIAARFRDSLLGAVWSVVNPLFSLAIYYYVFSIIFQARWAILRPDGQPADTPSALVIFTGLIAINFFSECLLRAPGLVRENPSYVKKIIFPLEILPLVAVGSALFTAGISLVLLVLFYIWSIGLPGWHILFFPLIFAALTLLALGVVYGLSALGVYLPDLKNVVGPVSMALMFLTPIFYPLSVIPADLRAYILLNPLTTVVEELRRALFAQAAPDGANLLALFAVSLLTLALGFYGFTKLRRGFADVL